MATRQILYVPILKTKAGERWALSHLTGPARARLRPLLELHSHATHELPEHLESLCEDLASDWGTDRWFYLDGVWLRQNDPLGAAAVLASVFAASEEHDLQALPVVRTAFDDSALEQVQAIVAGNGRGYLLRVTPADLNNPALIDSIVTTIELPRNRIDFLLDYRNHAMNLADDLPHIPHLNDWRLVIAASGVFPREPLHRSLCRGD